MATDLYSPGAVRINASKFDHKTLNEKIRAVGGDCTITGCLGERFIAAGMSEGHIDIEGTPGNALGAYLNGAAITVHGNAQDAVGDTMNDGEIIVHGSIGDAAGYAMRGGRIYVRGDAGYRGASPCTLSCVCPRGDAGYRAGIHMKEYKEKRPVMVIGGKCGSFLGEYQAGGIIIVLGLTDDSRRIVSNFPGTGMHGGVMYLRSDCDGVRFPKNVTARLATDEDMVEVESVIADYCEHFDLDVDEILDAPFTKVAPDSKNPYKQMYVAN